MVVKDEEGEGKRGCESGIAMRGFRHTTLKGDGSNTETGVVIGVNGPVTRVSVVVTGVTRVVRGARGVTGAGWGALVRNQPQYRHRRHCTADPPTEPPTH